MHPKDTANAFGGVGPEPNISTLINGKRIYEDGTGISLEFDQAIIVYSE